MFSWGLAIGGKKEIREWLINNGYKELGIFVYALHLKDDARNWLLKHYPHLMALINAVEENKQALQWLQKHEFEALYHVAKAALHHNESKKWLEVKQLKELLFVAQQIAMVKEQIDMEHNDVHKISKS